MRSLILILCTFVASFSVAFAQTTPNWATSVSLTPSTYAPMPGQQVTIKAESYSADLDGASIVWTVDGKTFKKGIGETEIIVTAPESGKTIDISLVAVAANGAELLANLTIGSGDVELILEPDGYSPSTFKGKVPLVYQNTFKITAIPHLYNSAGKEYDSKNLVYQWKRDWKALPNNSGYGKQSIRLEGEIVPRPYNIAVTVSTRDGKAVAEKYIAVNPGDPSIVFYKNDPLYGILYNKAQSGRVYMGENREISIIAEPFGFNKPKNSVGNLVFSWIINGTDQPDLSSNRSVTLRAPENTAGGAIVELTVQNKQEILQGGRNSLMAIFTIGESANQTAENTSF